MLRGLAPMVAHATRAPTRAASSTLPITREHDAKRKPIDEVLGTAEPKVESIRVVEEPNKGTAGMPVEHTVGRTARIYVPTREATQSAWGNTHAWRIELDNQGRWSNNLIGWASTADPLSNISMHLKFASKEEAIAHCEKNQWKYEVEEPHERKIVPKSYGWNYSWNKRCRNSTK